ncbi:hypothetical protein F4677DRAFT_86303 [Hypoxylon crocopeplum]|nr:hypothetical protein F4677DRAFT_86303 [Hypoxylon crocopeplum]
MYSTSCHSFELPEGQDYLQPKAPPSRESPLSELVELVPAIACSFVTTSYIVQTESMLDNLPPNIDSFSQNIIRIIRPNFSKIISPRLALGSCLVLGCCLSSYTHRRRDYDQCQAVVFITWIAWAICVGRGIGATANLVTLGIVPWATCAAILSSFFGHAGARWFSKRETHKRENVLSVGGEEGTPPRWRSW